MLPGVRPLALAVACFSALSPFSASAQAVEQAPEKPAVAPAPVEVPVPAPATPAHATPVEPGKAPAPTAPTAPGVPPARPNTPPVPTAPPSALADDGIRVAVLGYHDFSETQKETAMRMKPSKFRKQMEVIKQLGIPVVSMEDFLAWKRGEKTLPPKCIVITLDDGWKAVYTDAFPTLKEFGFPFTIFLYQQYVDGGGKALTSAMVREMQAAGATVGCHSFSHPYPATVKKHYRESPEAFDKFLRKEIGDSKKFLETQFGKPVTTYAYPGGYYTQEMFDLAKEYGYTQLFTVIPGKTKRNTPDMAVPRYIVMGDNDRIFEQAMNFQETGASATAGGNGIITGLIQTTPYPVTPEIGSVINDRLPKITADLSTVPDIDPATVVMKVGGFGEVPATFDPTTKIVSWMVNRPLRQKFCQVIVTWKDMQKKPPETPLRWSFQLDRDAAYLSGDE